MKERDLRNLIADVKTGQLSRRAFVQRMIAAGLSAPIAGMMLSQSGVAMAATALPYIRISPSAPRTRKAPGSFTSRWRDGTMTAIWCRSSLPRFRARRMMDWPRTAAR
jgi:hypothetical protein